MMYCDVSVLFLSDLTGGDAYPLVAEFAVAVVRRSLNWEGHGTDDQRPLDTELIDKRTSQEADQCEHNVIDGVGDVVRLSRSKTTTTQTCQSLVTYSLS